MRASKKSKCRVLSVSRTWVVDVAIVPQSESEVEDEIASFVDTATSCEDGGLFVIGDGEFWEVGADDPGASCLHCCGCRAVNAEGV